ncbi:ABC-2 type transport system ATP-binding protein [Microbacterium natoriense]|uniref:ABC-2 type transport system ATP-binding protein n=1 Tax=Microbacterium natoriense TaxID=284570 RepID=A0AAW8EXZ6_9MICO|nr:ATP-binding cassette domain-containing protein [Microbacterium natoriense]MDQ0647252.1 ABC-2 type transport system ATP-binding protein [Microbacterium natoriense]
MTSQLDVVWLRKSFGARPILDVALSLDAGDFCLILGENGAGKSTFFRCLLELDNHDGVVEVNGKRPRRHILGILDHPMLYPRWSAAANLRYVLNDSHADKIPVVQDLLGDLLRRPYGKMSTGQRKLVLLATLLASDADVLLLDEFSNGLDQSTRSRFREAVHRDLKERGRTIIATGHDLYAFESLPTRVMVLRDTQLTDITADYFSDRDLTRAYAQHVARNSA